MKRASPLAADFAMAGRGRSGPSSGRGKPKPRRKPSSARWIARQARDPYVAAAKRVGYRSRAAYKLIGLDDRFAFLRLGGRIVDLGAAPGGWSQVAARRVRAGRPGGGVVVALDSAEMAAIANVRILRLDARAGAADAAVLEVLGGSAHVVLSDMAAPATGHALTDHLRVVALCEVAFALAASILRPGGAFIAKVLQGGAEPDLLAALKPRFRVVRHAKPAASRRESAETYLVALDFRGVA